jgi:hypothetical protein
MMDEYLGVNFVREKVPSLRYPGYIRHCIATLILTLVLGVQNQVLLTLICERFRSLHICSKIVLDLPAHSP